MRVKDLKGWQQETKREKYSEGIRWEPVLRLVQVMFSYETVLEEIAWATMVLLQKDNGGYRVFVIL